ncbi:5-histidylcysteine sulfoxide synthase [Thalassotalea sp. LPB0316]|nr:5-histidylcysteine sulfoxide synthase [Thalassotalea sp. LPB0316]
MKTVLLTGDSIEAKRDELKNYFENTWQTYEALFSLINSDEAYFLRPEPLRHPLIFYYGHTATFFINKLMLGKYINQRVNEKLEAICAVGVDEMSWDDLDATHYDWPSVDEVRAYRNQVYQLICQLIDEMPLSLPITQDSLAWVIMMGCEHERIHLETSSVIMRMLDSQYLTPKNDWQACSSSGAAPQNSLLPAAGHTVTLGKPVNADTYGWDNEYGSAQVEVPDFNASQYLVSNGEYMAFVEAGGYQKPEFWTEEGQSWLAYKQASMPRFWFKENGNYYQRNLLNAMPLPLDWPVEVNYLEAKAFCNWLGHTQGKNIRLPSEAEWYCLRDRIQGDITQWPEAKGNINLEYYASSCPVNRFEHKQFYDVIGNVWQWTESAIDGFNGFEVHPLYDDFSTPTFDGKHNLIKGGSWISTGNEAIKYSRYAFRRHFMQHAGFRYIESHSDSIPDIEVNHFITNKEITQQLACYYAKGGDHQFAMPNYADQLAQKVSDISERYQTPRARLLELGCSVGKTSFLLSSLFEQVDGVDFSARFIQHAVKLQQGEAVRYSIENEGEIVDFNEVTLSQFEQFNGQSIQPQNVLFSQGDAGNLKPIFTDYDIIVAQQLLEQCYDARSFLAQVADRLNSRGLFILVSDYSINPERVPAEKRLGGTKINGENVTGFDAVSEILMPSFELIEQDQMTKVIPQNNRQARLSIMHISVWQKAN